MIIDAYSHFVNRKAVEGFIKDPEILAKIPDVSVEEMKDKWLEIMKKHDVEKIIFLAVMEGEKEFEKFIDSDEKFIGVTNVNVLKEGAVSKLEEAKKKGYKGLALYPVWDSLDLADKRIYGVYEFCEKNGWPIVIHFGVSVRPGDLRFGNPISLSPVLRDFKNLKVIIAHFGAGYFNESLMLMYKNDNVYFDTSGTNNWLDNVAFDWSLKDVFKKSFDAIGVDRVIGGSDTYKLMEEGYRSEILEKQKSIVKELLGEEGVKKVFYDNAKKVYGI